MHLKEREGTGWLAITPDCVDKIIWKWGFCLLSYLEEIWTNLLNSVKNIFSEGVSTVSVEDEEDLSISIGLSWTDIDYKVTYDSFGCNQITKLVNQNKIFLIKLPSHLIT